MPDEFDLEDPAEVYRRMASDISPQNISMRVYEGAGATSLFDAEMAAKAQGELQDALNARVRRLQGRILSSWTGPASMAAADATSPIAQLAIAATDALARAQSSHADQHGSFNYLQNSMKPIPHVDDASALEKAFPMFSDYDEQMDAYNAACKENWERYLKYDQQTSGAGDGLPANFGTAQQSPWEIEAPGDTERVYDDSEEKREGHERFRDFLKEKYVSEEKIIQQPVVPTDILTPTQATPGHSSDDSNPWGKQETSTMGFSPQGTVIPAANLSGVSVATSAASVTTPTNFDSGRDLVLNHLYGSESDRVTGRAEKGFNAGKSTGVGTPGANPAGMKAASMVAGERMNGGMPMMGSPAGGKNAGDEDSEHQRPAYLLEYDTHDIFLGGLPKTTQPVIGA